MAVVSNGTTLIDNGALDAGVPTGSLILLSTQTASASANISFTTGLDSTYSSYVFKFIDIHPATQSDLQVGFRDGATNYDATVTSTFFASNHYEADSGATLEYKTSYDLAQSTNFQTLSFNVGTENDECSSGYLQLFNPSSTTYVKHFISTSNGYHGSDILFNNYVAGYCNTTTAIDGVQFKFGSGNIDDGIIKLYGVK
jgi:hypothetical protein